MRRWKLRPDGRRIKKTKRRQARFVAKSRERRVKEEIANLNAAWGIVLGYDRDKDEATLTDGRKVSMMDLTLLRKS